MKLEHVVILVLALVMVFVTLRPQIQTVLVELSERDVPVTWNYDWDGGPGRDRHRIMHEEGPYL